ncbi:hypothetical protein [Streptomyces sp. NPDC007100]|uniref:MmyB family transcriptional regulator n=1 Tax=Streptomyces sp. NPDC007100 TaxID=3155602 RepID=UPI0033EA5C1A
MAWNRAEAGLIGDPAFERLTAELRGRSAEFRTWWDTHDATEFRPARRVFDHPRLGRLTFDYVTVVIRRHPTQDVCASVSSEAHFVPMRDHSGVPAVGEATT